jgi:hypothetical protein
MNYVDFTIAASLFLIFFTLAILFSTNYFSNLSSLTRTNEFRSTSEDFFKLFFESEGVPENWHKDYPNVPVKVGLAEDLYFTRVLVKEDAGLNRTDEPVTVHIIFDEDCENKSWNNTIRMYDEDWNELNIEISNTTNCSNTQYLNQTDLTWKINISANETKKYWFYYSPDDTVTVKIYSSLLYNTSSWIPNDRDSWTEAINDWSRYGGSNGTVTSDTTNKIRGSSSVNITGTFDSTSLGLEYNPSNNITGVSNGWYLDSWIYIDDISNLNSFIVRLSDNNDNIYVNIVSNLTSNTWYHLEKELKSTEWLNWTNFNASQSIDYIIFYMENSTSDLTKTLKVDGLHFKKKPLEVKAFPEESLSTVSSNKFDVLQNISYDEIRKSVGENYKFRLEVGNEAYGGDFNNSANVGCADYPKVIENKNGTISKDLVRICVWK